MEMNVARIGHVYDRDSWDVTEYEIKTYAAGYNDLDNPLFKAAEIAPPMYATRYTAGSMYRPLFDDVLGADMRRLVHGEHDMQWFGLPKPGDRVETVTSVHSLEEKSTGELMNIKMESYIAGTQISSIMASFFVRAKKRPEEKKAEPKAPPPPPPPRPPTAFTQKMYVTNDQTYRYAEGSGDHNFIHVDNAAAIAAGLPGIILQGLCTMAFGTKAIMDNLLDKDPRRLKRFAVRFSKPVRPYDILTTEGWIIEEKPGRKIVGVEIKNQDGAVVLSNGKAEVEA